MYNAPNDIESMKTFFNPRLTIHSKYYFNILLLQETIFLTTTPHRKFDSINYTVKILINIFLKVPYEKGATERVQLANAGKSLQKCNFYF